MDILENDKTGTSTTVDGRTLASFVKSASVNSDAVSFQVFLYGKKIIICKLKMFLISHLFAITSMQTHLTCGDIKSAYQSSQCCGALTDKISKKKWQSTFFSQVAIP